MRHLRTVLALVLTVATFTLTAVAQTGGTGAVATEKLTNEKRVAEAAAAVTEETGAPKPFNILDEADDELFLALAGFSSKYRMSPGVQDGDWVKYKTLGDGPEQFVEIRAEKEADGGVWLIETTTPVGGGESTELRLLFTPGKPKLVKALRVAADGTREDVTPLDPTRAGELFIHAKNTAIDALGGDRKDMKVYDSGDVQNLEGPFGKLTCRAVEVRVAEEVDPISFATRRRWLPEGTLIWLNEDVPRLMPMSAVLLPVLISPDDFMAVPGGMVRSPYHVLVDYKGRS